MSWWIGGTVAVALGLLFLPLGNVAWRWLLGAGAIISAVIFPITLKLYGIVPMEFLLFLVGVAGFLITFFLGEETKDKSLEELSS